jgi:hypothetical protein
VSLFFEVPKLAYCSSISFTCGVPYTDWDIGILGDEGVDQNLVSIVVVYFFNKVVTVQNASEYDISFVFGILG